MTKRHLTVVGTRQSGKTYRLIRIAIEQAVLGERVLYSARDRRAMQEVFNRIEQITTPLGVVDKFRRRNGDEKVVFTSGGAILFHAEQVDMFDELGTHILDENENEPLEKAVVSYRSALR